MKKPRALPATTLFSTTASWMVRSMMPWSELPQARLLRTTWSRTSIRARPPRLRKVSLSSHRLW
jgi:hypothetical protein